MHTERLYLHSHQSAHAKQGQLIISAITASWLAGKVEIVIGRIGFASVTKTLKVGGAVLFETPDEGLFEIRVMNINIGNPDTADIMISQLGTTVAPIAGVRCDDFAYENTPFQPEELRRLKASLSEVYDSVKTREDLTPEQIDFIHRKLDEMATAATRIGRKDWINLAVGTLANVVVSAGLGSETARFLFHRMSQAFIWLLGEGLKLLP